MINANECERAERSETEAAVAATWEKPFGTGYIVCTDIIKQVPSNVLHLLILIKEEKKTIDELYVLPIDLRSQLSTYTHTTLAFGSFHAMGKQSTYARRKFHAFKRTRKMHKSTDHFGKDVENDGKNKAAHEIGRCNKR